MPAVKAALLGAATLTLLAGCSALNPKTPLPLPRSCTLACACPPPYDPAPRGPDNTGECYCQAPELTPDNADDPIRLQTETR